MMFCKEYNARTQDKAGEVVPVVITVYEDKSFSFITKTPPTAELIKKYAKIDKGSGTPFGREQKLVGQLSKGDVEEIAKIKLPELFWSRGARGLRQPPLASPQWASPQAAPPASASARQWTS